MGEDIYTNTTNNAVKLDITVTEGTVLNVRSDSDVIVNGDIQGGAQAGNNVTCSGNVGQSVQAGNNIKCAKVGGSAIAGNNISYL